MDGLNLYTYSVIIQAILLEYCSDENTQPFHFHPPEDAPVSQSRHPSKKVARTLITERRVPKLIPVLGSQTAGE